METAVVNESRQVWYRQRARHRGELRRLARKICGLVGVGAIVVHLERNLISFERDERNGESTRDAANRWESRTKRDVERCGGEHVSCETHVSHDKNHWHRETWVTVDGEWDSAAAADILEHNRDEWCDCNGDHTEACEGVLLTKANALQAAWERAETLAKELFS